MADRPRTGVDQGRKPDFGDAGYGQVGCLFVVAGIVIGVLLAVVLAVWLDPAAVDGDALVQLAGILVLAYAAGGFAFGLAAAVISRVPALWRWQDAVFGAMFIGPVLAVPIAVYVPIVARWVWPIVGVAAVLAFGPIVWAVVVGLWRGSFD